MGHHQLDTLDEQILQLIADNARIPFLEVARACNVSGAAIHQRIQKLTNLGILKGSEYVIIVLSLKSDRKVLHIRQAVGSHFRKEVRKCLLL